MLRKGIRKFALACVLCSCFPISVNSRSPEPIVSRRGTLLIVVYCREGIVVAADSAEVSTELGQVRMRQKIYPAGRLSVVGFAGTTSLALVRGTDTSKKSVLYEVNLFEGVKRLLDGLPSGINPTRAHDEITKKVGAAIERFFVNTWGRKPNTQPEQIVGIMTTGYEGRDIVLLFTDFYRPIEGPRAIGRRDGRKKVPPGKFAIISFAEKKTCAELLEGSNPALQESRRLPIVRLYRQRKAENKLDAFTLSESVELARACLDVTEKSGELIDPEAHQVRPPNWVATITRSHWFRWVLKGGTPAY